MASTNGSGRPPGSISIPVEIIRDSNTGSSLSNSRHASPYRANPNDIPYSSGFAGSPPWNSSLNNSLNGRFQPRQSPSTAYDRVINNSQFNQPLNDRSSFRQFQEPTQERHPQQRLYEPGPSHFSRSSEDLLSSPFDSMYYHAQPQNTSLFPPSFNSGFRTDSDFVQPGKYQSQHRRSFDALSDFPDMQRVFPTTRRYAPEQQPQQQQQQHQPQPQQQQQPQYRSTFQTQRQPQQHPQQPMYSNQAFINPNIVYTNEFGVPTDQYRPNTPQNSSHYAHERSHSPASQRGASPARPPPTATTTSQLPDEPELKMAKDSEGPIPMPPPASASSPMDQQVPSTDASDANTVSPPPPAEPVRDPDAIATEKLEQLKVQLNNWEKQVDEFTGTSRHDRTYAALDEQAIKIMIQCDALVDVSADIKEKRKEMIRNVQRVLGKLEAKVPQTPAADENSNPVENLVSTDISPINQSVEDSHDQQNSMKKTSHSTSPSKETGSIPTSEQAAST